MALSTLTGMGVLAPLQAQAASTTIYVDNADPNCSDTAPGSGTQAQPFCQVTQAGAAAQPGDTVLVAPSPTAYEGTRWVNGGSLTIPVNGTPGQPITFKAAGPGVTMGSAGCGGLGGFFMVGQHDLTIDGFQFDLCGGAGVEADNSQNVSVINDTFTETASNQSLGNTAAVVYNNVTGGSVSGDTMSLWQDLGAVEMVSRTSNIDVAHNTIRVVRNGQASASAASQGITSYGPGNRIVGNTMQGANATAVLIGPAGSGSVVAGNYLLDDVGGVWDNGASNVDITGNTVIESGASEYAVSGSVTGVLLENNIASFTGGLDPNMHLAGISVDPVAAPGVTADDNDVAIPFVLHSTEPYAWISSAYASAADFNAATHQGAHDTNAAPNLAANGVPLPGSPDIDSAYSDAPGEQPTDLLGNPRHDDPGTPDTGSGTSTYFDRGAFEYQGDSTPAPAPPATPPPGVSPGAGPNVYRDAGADRTVTGIAISQQKWTATGSAKAVVLATSRNFPDALSGGPLAAKKGGPLLLTDGSTARLDERVQAEIQRVLPGGGAVYVLGGDTAVNPAIVAQLKSLGYVVTQFKGRDRADTALQVAESGLGSPQHVVLATGIGYADALSAGPYAAGPFADGPGAPAAIVLSNGSTLDAATAAFLRGKTVATVGGPAAQAWPGAAESFAGGDRFATAALVADQFTGSFANTQVGIANGVAAGSNPGYPDALTGGAFMAESNGPIVLVDGIHSTVPSQTQRILANRTGNVRADIFGGTTVISPALAASVVALLHGTAQF